MAQPSSSSGHFRNGLPYVRSGKGPEPLVIHSSAHTLGDAGKRVQLKVGHLARQGRVAQAWEAMIDFVLYHAFRKDTC